MMYDTLAKGYEELYGEEQLAKISAIISLIGKGSKTLDIGCGTAFYAKLFKDYTGIDSSIEMVKKARLNGNIFYGKAESIPFKDKSFDKVICVSAIHNFDDIEKSILEMKRVSKSSIAISVMKKSKKFEYIKNQLNNFKEVDIGKDALFINQTS